MYVQRQEPPDLTAVLNRGCFPDLTARARAFVTPLLDEVRTPVFEPEDRPPVPLAGLTLALAEATNRRVVDIVLLPDDSGLPQIRKMAQEGSLAPKLRLGEILHRAHGTAINALSEDVRRKLRAALGVLFRLDDQAAALTPGLEYAVRVSRRDALYYFLGAAIVGDERRTRAISPLIQLMRRAVPLAMVNESAGIWLAHRP